MKMILDNLWQVGGDELTHPADAAIYLIRFGTAAALVDAGTGHGHDQMLTNIARCLPAEVPIDYLLLTHCHFDHTGGAAAARRIFSCRIVVHALDAAYLETGDSQVTAAAWYGERMAPLPIDLKLDQEETVLPIGSGAVTAVHWPGHSPGSVIYHTEISGQRIVFGQDVHGPIHPALRSNEKQYQASLAKLLDLDADLLLEGHFGIYRGKTAVQKFIRSFMR
ncbi:MAG: MBL fold metallo-hydrolase [Desulfobacteraceae bacterium]|nr:MBL fold metallo-hydrolase [Desulfobacteraceae bacterium]